MLKSQRHRLQNTVQFSDFLMDFDQLFVDGLVSLNKLLLKVLIPITKLT
jgi:hypothetical protein